MSKLPSSKQIIKTNNSAFLFFPHLGGNVSVKHVGWPTKGVTKNGFIFVSQRGSHAKFKKGNRIVIVPTPKKEIPAGTFRSIIRQSGLTREDF